MFTGLLVFARLGLQGRADPGPHRRGTDGRRPEPVPADGLPYSNDLGRRLQHRPQDPAGHLAAAWHVYKVNPCANEDCWYSTLTPVAAEVPLVTHEIGENTCSHGFADRVMQWLDDRGPSYLGWAWNAWDRSTGPSLISDYDGTPTPYEIGLRDHLRALDS
ncbi:hypothetical protein ABZS61_23965 [Streptomyces sp. NPDC005566]|uniref:hypothetical protein n=1 Tax=Streptomyces sp. NPDC005566 TaxID=3156886 RepID=UPI0033B6266F